MTNDPNIKILVVDDKDIDECNRTIALLKERYGEKVSVITLTEAKERGLLIDSHEYRTEQDLKLKKLIEEPLDLFMHASEPGKKAKLTKREQRFYSRKHDFKKNNYRK